MSQKKFPFLNSLQLCQILSDFFALLESVLNLLQNLYNITHLILGRLLHYLGKLKKKSIFYRYSTDMEDNENKVHFKCTNFNSFMHVAVYAESIDVLTEYLKYLAYEV